MMENSNSSEYSFGDSYEYEYKDYNEKDWFPEDGVPDPSQDPIGSLLKFLQKPEVMGNLETLLHESYKFIRMADDLHDIRNYLNDMRICFIALTISGYIGIFIYALVLCLRRRKTKSSRRRSNEHYDQERAQMTGGGPQTQTWDGDVSVRSEPAYRFQPQVGGLRHARLSRMETMDQNKSSARDGFKESLMPASNPTDSNGRSPLMVPSLAKDTLSPLANTEQV